MRATRPILGGGVLFGGHIMYAVIWSNDTDSPAQEFIYFTRGSLAEQLADAQAFADSLGVDPERGYVVVKCVINKEPDQSPLGKLLRGEY